MGALLSMVLFCFILACWASAHPKSGSEIQVLCRDQRRWRGCRENGFACFSPLKGTAEKENEEIKARAVRYPLKPSHFFFAR